VVRVERERERERERSLTRKRVLPCHVRMWRERVPGVNWRERERKRERERARERDSEVDTLILPSSLMPHAKQREWSPLRVFK
jgi:hypothetical protein